jgi:transcriptional regulator with XRE-family HTH domain
MKDRIKEYMDYKSISAGELATLLDVQRSNISHVLNGRNLPGASFIEKFLLSFPDLNARWLITGHGNMIAGNIVPEPKEKQDIKEILIPKEPVKTTNIARSESRTIDKVVVLFSDGTFLDYNKK